MPDCYPILGFDDIAPIAERDNGEPLRSLEDYCVGIERLLIEPGATPRADAEMFARTGVATRLRAVQTEVMASFGAAARLVVTYAFRHPDDQQRFHNAALDRARARAPDADPDALMRRANQEAASPSVAGHPTGGAVDVTIRRSNGELLDTGHSIADFSRPAFVPTISSAITAEQQANRLTLRRLMVAQHFAPFHGEWWHFSYGDKEWAAFYGEPHALYGPIYPNAAR
ncbi:MAG: M15 family metallopeptidase [Pseudomonadota bacterium]